MADTIASVLTALGPLLNTVILAVIAALAQRYLHVTVTADQREVLRNATAAGAGAAYAELARTGGSITDPAALSKALNVGFQHVLTSAGTPPAMAAQGLSDSHVYESVTARLGNLLAADPSVTVDPKPPATAGLCAVQGYLPPTNSKPA